MGEKCPFEVEMEFGLGEFAEEECDFLTGGHEHSLAGTRKSKSDAAALQGAEKPQDERLMGELRLAGVFPGGEPVGADVGGGVGDLTDEDGACLIIEVVIIFVGVSVEAAAGVAISVENCFKPAMRT